MRVQWSILASLSVAAAASADVVDMARIGYGNGRMVTATLGSQKMTVFAGRILHQTSDGTGSLANLPSNIVTFCAEILQGQADAPTPYTLSSVATLSGNTGLTNLGLAKQQAIYDLYAAAAGRQFTLGLDYACAFQIAVWEVIYDYNTAPRGSDALSVTSGNFQVALADGSPLTASISDKISFLLGSVGSHSSQGGVIGFHSTAFQDQLYENDTDTIVPLPHGVWAGMAGLALAGAARLRRRK
jgi:hypothetical protein